MSKPNRPFLLLSAVFLHILQILNNVQGQTIEAAITVPAPDSANVKITGRFLDAQNEKVRRNFSFLRSAAGTEGHAKRISELHLSNGNGAAVPFREMIDGEFLADSDIVEWSYSVDLEPPADPTASAHISWLSGDAGILMLDDLLPQLGREGTARVAFRLPQGWAIHSSLPVSSNGYLEIKDPSRAVFLIGNGWRRQTVNSGATQIDLLIRGEWRFADEDLTRMAAEVFAEYRKIFGSSPSDRVQIVVSRFPAGGGHNVWQAETRGTNVLILSGDMAFKTQSLQRLHEQLRHEIFHLWLPNGVNLTGNYDWFYEGFALYQSLKTGTLIGRLRFEDFLDTLSRAHNIDRSQSRRVSLMEASEGRWRGGNTQVYARGMVVAFLADLALLQSSGGKRSVSDIFSVLYKKHAGNGNAIAGNEAVLTILSDYPELASIVERYVRGSDLIAWAGYLDHAGIETVSGGRALKTREKLSGRQKSVLDKLGYNSWRKFASRSK